MKKILAVTSVLTILVLIIVLKVNPGIFTPKKSGSFEYVRKGEALLEKGRYQDAISYFEKAHEASGENNIIKSGLVYAYSKYAAVLGGANDYGKALDYLSRACEVVKDSNTIQNLALMYSKKAVFQAQRGNWAGALEDVTSARLVASESQKASKNLGISLFNDAFNEYKNGREKAAILLLKEASLSHEDPRILEFLGDVYYKRTETDRALFYWDKAKGLDPENKGVTKKLLKLSKEMELAAASRKKQLPHFEIRYEKNLNININLVQEILEQAYRAVGNDLKYFPGDKTVVFFYSEPDFRNIFALPAIIRAFYDGNIRMPLPQSMTGRDELTRYIYHEYAHAVVSAKTKNNCPIWLNEGIAVWQEFRNDDAALIAAFTTADELPEFSIKALAEGFSAQKGDPKIYYLAAYTAVKYVLDNWGKDGLRDILERIADGQHVTNAIDDEFLLSEKEFTERWAAYAREKYLKIK